MMAPYWLEWSELLLRWLHLLVGVAWIGASLHFVLVDRSLISDPEDEVVKGRFWAIHGGASISSRNIISRRPNGRQRYTGQSGRPIQPG